MKNCCSRIPFHSKMGRIFFVRVSGDCKDEISHLMLCSFLCSQLECQGKSQKDHRNWSHALLKGGSPPLQEWIPRGNWSKIPEEEGWCCPCIQCGKPVMSDTKNCTCNKYDFCWQQSWCVDVMSCMYSGTPAYDHPLLWPFFSSLNCKSGLIFPFEKKNNNVTQYLWPNSNCINGVPLKSVIGRNESSPFCPVFDVSNFYFNNCNMVTSVL